MDGQNEEKISIEEFAKRIREKSGAYHEVDDYELVERAIRKDPVYASRVKLPSDFRLLKTSSGYQKIDDLYEQIGREENVDPNLLLEQGRQETAFDPDVFYGRRVSRNAQGKIIGASGSGQFMPGTAQRFKVDVSDPISGIRGQAKYMRTLLDQFEGDENLALAGYNAGEGAVIKHGKKIPPYKETQDYVTKITAKLKEARAKGLSLKAPTIQPTNPPISQPQQSNIGTIQITGQSPNGSYSGITSTTPPPPFSEPFGGTVDDLVKQKKPFIEPEQPKQPIAQKFNVPPPQLTAEQPNGLPQNIQYNVQDDTVPNPTVRRGEGIITPEQQELEGQFGEYLKALGKTTPTKQDYAEFNQIQKDLVGVVNQQNQQAVNQYNRSLPRQPQTVQQPNQRVTQNAVNQTQIAEVPIQFNEQQQQNFEYWAKNNNLDTSEESKRKYVQFKRENQGQYDGYIEAKNDKEILAKGSAGTAQIDLRNKPKGENSGKFLLRSALQQIAPQYELTNEEIEQAINDTFQETGKYSQINNDITDEQIQGLVKNKQNTQTRFAITNKLINGILQKRYGQLPQSINTPTTQQENKDFINPELRTDIQMKDAEARVGSRDLEGSNERVQEEKTRKEIESAIRNPEFGLSTVTDALQKGIAKGVNSLSPFGIYANIREDLADISDKWNNRTPQNSEEKFQELYKKQIDAIKKDFGSFNEFQKAKEYVAQMDVGEFAIRGNAAFWRSVVNTTVSSNLQGLDVVDKYLEKTHLTNAIIPEDLQLSLRNVQNALGYTMATLLGRTDKFKPIGEDTDANKRLFYTIGSRINEYFGEDKYLGKTGLGAKTAFTQILADNLGSMSGFLLLGLLAPQASIGRFSLTSAIPGALGQTGSMYEQAKQKGASENQALTAGFVGTLLGSTEGLGAGAALSKALSNTERKAFMQAVLDFGVDVAEEGGQETFQRVGSDAFFKYLEQKDKPLLEKIQAVIADLPQNIGKNAVEGGIPAGFLGGLFGQGVKFATRDGKTAPTSTVETPNDLTLEQELTEDDFPPVFENIETPLPPIIETVNQRGQRPVTEAPETVQAHLESAQNPETQRVAVLYTEGETEPPPPQGFVRVPVSEGILQVNTEKAQALNLNNEQEIADYVANNGVSSLIGKVEEIKDTSQANTLFSTDKVTGKEVSASVVTTPESAQAQAELDKINHPNIELEQELLPTQEAIAKRESLKVGEGVKFNTLAKIEVANENLTDQEKYFIKESELKDTLNNEGFSEQEQNQLLNLRDSSSKTVLKHFSNQQKDVAHSQWYDTYDSIQDTAQAFADEVSRIDLVIDGLIKQNKSFDFIKKKLTNSSTFKLVKFLSAPKKDTLYDLYLKARVEGRTKLSLSELLNTDRVLSKFKSEDGSSPNDNIIDVTPTNENKTELQQPQTLLDEKPNVSADVDKGETAKVEPPARKSTIKGQAGRVGFNLRPKETVEDITEKSLPETAKDNSLTVSESKVAETSQKEPSAPKAEVTSNFTKGDTVTYKNKQYEIQSVSPNNEQVRLKGMGRTVDAKSVKKVDVAQVEAKPSQFAKGKDNALAYAQQKFGKESLEQIQKDLVRNFRLSAKEVNSIVETVYPKDKRIKDATAKIFLAGKATLGKRRGDISNDLRFRVEKDHYLTPNEVEKIIQKGKKIPDHARQQIIDEWAEQQQINDEDNYVSENPLVTEEIKNKIREEYPEYDDYSQNILRDGKLVTKESLELKELRKEKESKGQRPLKIDGQPILKMSSENDQEISYNKNYEETRDVATGIRSGEFKIERLDNPSEQGRVKGGQRNVEASLILAGKTATGQSASTNDGARVENHSENPSILKRSRDEKGIEDAQKEVRGAYTDELLEVVKADDYDQQGYIVTANNVEAWELLNQIVDEMNPQEANTIDGVFLDTKQTSKFLHTIGKIERQAKEGGLTTDQTKVLRDIKALVRNAQTQGDGSVIIALYDDAVKHEKVHRAAYLGGNEVKNKNVIQAMPEYKKFVEGLKSRQNTPDGIELDFYVVWQEALAFLSTENPSKFGLTDVEAANLLTEIMSGFVEANGVKSLDSFIKLDNETLLDTINKVYEKENSKTSAGNQKDSGTDKESSQGKQTRQESVESEPIADDSSEQNQESEDRRLPDQSGVNTKLASLPKTLRRYGYDAIDVAYEKYGDTEASAEAVRLFNENGIDGSIKLLKETKEHDAQHTILADMVYKTMRDAAIETNDTALRTKSDEFLKDFSLRLIRAGRSIRAVQLADDSASVNIVKTAEQIAQDKGGTLSPEELAQFSEQGLLLENANAEVTKLGKTISNLKGQITKLKNKLTSPLSARKQRRLTIAKTRLINNIAQDHEAEVKKALLEFQKEFGGNTILKMSSNSISNPILKMSATDPKHQQKIDLISKVGAMELVKGIGNDQEFLTTKFRTLLEGTFGESNVSPFFDEIYQQSMTLRDKWLDEENKKRKIELAGRELEKLPKDVTDDDLYKFLNLSRDEKRKADAVERIHRIMSGVFQNKITDELQSMINDIAPTAQMAQVASLIARKGSTNDVMKALGIEQKEAESLMLQGNKIVQDAKTQIEEHKTEIERLISESEKTITDFEYEKMKAAEERKKLQRSISDKLERLENNTVFDKVKRGYKSIFDVVRNLTFSGEMSYQMRQAGKFLHSEFVNQVFRGFKKYETILNQNGIETKEQASESLITAQKKGLSSAWSHDNFLRDLANLEKHPSFTESVRMGIEYSNAGKLSGMEKLGEEELQSEAVAKIHEWLSNRNSKTGKTLSYIPKQYLGLIERFDEAMGMTLDVTRLTIYDRLRTELIEQGFDPKKDKAEFEELARRINTGTGRPNNFSNRNVQGAVNFVKETRVFGSPSYTISKWQDLLADTRNIGKTAYGIASTRELPKGTQRVMAGRAIRSYGALMTKYALLAYALGMLVSFDPDDDDYLKLKLPQSDFRFDLTAGNRSELKLIGQTVKRIYAMAGERFGFETPKPTKSTFDVIKSHASYKTHQLWQFGYGATTGKDLIGKEFSLKDPFRYANLVAPMTWVEATKNTTEYSWKGFGALPLQFIGVGVSAYPDKLTQDSKKTIREKARDGEISEEQKQKALQDKNKQSIETKIKNREKKIAERAKGK